MAIDTRRLILTAVEAALKDESPAPKKRRQLLPPRRAILLGAGLMAAGRLAVGSRGREVMGTLQERLAEFEERLSDNDQEPEDLADDEELVDEEQLEDEEEFDDEDEGDFDEAEVEDEEPVA